MLQVSIILEFLSAVGVSLSHSAFLWHQASLVLHSGESVLDINYAAMCSLDCIPHLNLLKSIYWKPSFLSMLFSHFFCSWKAVLWSFVCLLHSTFYIQVSTSSFLLVEVRSKNSCFTSFPSPKQNIVSRLIIIILPSAPLS